MFQVDESQGWVRRMRREVQETLAGTEGGCGCIEQDFLLCGTILQ